MKRSRLYRPMASLLLGASMFSLFSCGYENNTQKDLTSSSQQAQGLAGSYRVRLDPVNPQFGNNLSADFEVEVQGENLQVNLDVKGAPASIMHAQHIHGGSACPTQADDTNNDGVLDITETQAVVGEVIIPLDADLSSPDAGKEEYPVADDKGDYVYAEETVVSSLLNDLNDNAFELAGKPVVIHGIAADTALPETVDAAGADSPHELLPIACGIIERTDDGGTTTGGTDGGTTTGGTDGGTATGGTDGGTATGGTDGGTTTGGTDGGTTTGGASVTGGKGGGTATGGKGGGTVTGGKGGGHTQSDAAQSEESFFN
jgi:hypothetical protein